MVHVARVILFGILTVSRTPRSSSDNTDFKMYHVARTQTRHVLCAYIPKQKGLHVGKLYKDTIWECIVTYRTWIEEPPTQK